MTQSLLVTGGAGFIGVNFVNHWARGAPGPHLVVLDALTYAGNRASLAPLEGSGRIEFVEGDICDSALVARVMSELSVLTPSCILRQRAMSTDRSRAPMRLSARIFRAPTSYFPLRVTLGCRARVASTVFITFLRTRYTDHSLLMTRLSQRPLATSRIRPYSASKAGSDHMVRAYHHTYGLQVTTSNCSNNYGPVSLPREINPPVPDAYFRRWRTAYLW